MRKHVSKWFLFVIVVATLSVPIVSNLFVTAEAKEPVVYKVPVSKEVEKGLYAFLNRSFKEAKEADAEAIVLDIHTPGGLVDAAGQIAKLLNTSEIPVYAYINDDALSAGAFLALHAKEIYMSPIGRIGAAQVIEGSGNAADDKAHSAWLSAMKNAAESSGRKTLYAEAMANPDIDLPEYDAKKGELLTLTAKEALEVGYSEGTVASFDELLAAIGYEDAKIVSTTETFSENLARFITHPVVIPILLSVAGLGLVVELYSPGFGVPGTMAIVSLLLFFYGHLIAGFAGYETLLLFVIGAALIITEFFISGGIAGVIGAVAIVGSIIMAGGNPMNMAFSVLFALAMTALGAVIIIKIFGKKLHLFNKVVLMDATDTESGYVSNVTRTELLGQVGETITPLRPSGTIDLKGERIDVVSEGSYIDRGKDVTIVKVEGSRVVVREVTKKEENEL